jgi:hypothetical protein
MSGRGLAMKSIELIRVSYELLEQIQPASVRSVCYQLFNRGIISSMTTGETQKVSRLLVYTRENKIIPWEWIVDETREPERVSAWSSLADYGEAVLRSYRRNFWDHQSDQVEVWSEKETIRGVLAPVLDQFAVTFSVKHGFDSATSINNIAVETGDNARPLIVLYVGDWDPSGLCMSERDLSRRLSQYGASVDLRRIALTQGDVKYGDLPSFPADTKTKDPRYRWFVENYGRECWELDALLPPDLRDVLSHIDIETWDYCARIEAAEWESLRSFKWDRVSVSKYRRRGRHHALHNINRARSGDDSLHQ